MLLFVLYSFPVVFAEYASAMENSEYPIPLVRIVGVLAGRIVTSPIGLATENGGRTVEVIRHVPLLRFCAYKYSKKLFAFDLRERSRDNERLLSFPATS